ncbi:SEL1-like repeat protein [Brevundimonas sp.]|uniref:SEL1-like repeat protein n=1 Tax=Brevundimonas sp. TaxID=1871086 RepID=UPI002FC5CD48
MSAAAPWSVKGIEPKAREIAKDLARRSGMTLGEWLNTIIMEDGDDDEGVVPLSRRPHAAESYERRGRSRRMDDAYGGADNHLDRLAASIDAIAARLEAAERRSTIAIQGVDQAVSGLVRRLDNQDQSDKVHVRRIDDIAEELREGHRRLRRFEQEVGPQTAETFGKVETTLGALAGRLYDIEERQRTGANELRQRMDAVEKAAGPGVGAELLAQVGQRLDQAQIRTTEALRGLERSFAGLDQRLRATEGRVEPESAREAARFEKLAETLSRQVEGNRAEMMRRLDTAETEGRMDRIERAVLSIGDQVKSSEERSAKAVEAMGREVLRIAQNLNGRVQTIEGAAPLQLDAISRKVESDMGRLAQGLEQRLTAADDRHALALEKLGGEITRISDRLSERIAQSERRSQQALEDIGRRLADSSSKIEQGYDRASGELAERMRLSEERTAALIAEARGNIERRAEPARSAATEPDWRAAAFPDAAFPDAGFGETAFDDPVYAEQQAWSADLAPPESRSTAPGGEALSADSIFDAVLRGPRIEPETPADTTPFGSRPAPPPTEAAAEPAFAQTVEPSPAAPAPEPASPPAAFGQGFGGADVSDALQATAPAFDAGPDDFAGETDFVDPRALRAAAAQGRASSTRQAIDAARAAMASPEAVEAPARTGFGLKKGGKSKLQERLDKQASRGGGTVRKALGASAIAVLLTGGGAYATGQLTGSGLHIPGLTAAPEAQPIAALAVLPAAPTQGDLERGADLYQQAIELLDADAPSGVDTLKRAAATGYTPAQLHLASLYQDGAKGVPVNLREARVWARRAADGGDAKGMHAYGMYLFEGVGGARDQGEALAWLRKAAERGLVDSQFNVAKLYETGDEAIQPDPAQAYKWYLIAARAGDGDAQAAVERLDKTIAAATRTQVRAEAEKFQVEPLA